MATALTTYFTNVAATTLPNASTLATTTGGVSIGIDNLISTSTGYGEFRSLGNVGAWAALGSLPAQSGRGMLLDATTLEGQAMVGTWTPTVRGSIHGGNGNITADIIMRVSVYHAGGTYTTVGTTTLAAQSITGTTATYTFAGATLSEADFSVGDKLYLELFFNVTANANTLTVATLRFNFSSTGTTGNVTNQMVTPGFYAITSVSVTDSAAGADSEATGVALSPITDTSAGADAQTLGTVAITISDAGVGGDGADIAGRSPLSQAFNMAGVPLGGPYVVKNGINFAQNGVILPRLYGSTFYPATEGGSPLYQGTSAQAWIDGVISTYVANGLKVLRPTDQWGGNAGLTWDNPNIWQNMDYFVQQAYLNGLYIQMDLSGWKAVLTARGQYPFAPDLWTGFLQEVGAHYSQVPNILFYAIAGEPTFPKTQADVNALVSFFTQTIATLKAADANHLISPGGFINMNNGLSNWWQQIWQLSGVDVCCYKSYSLNDLNNVATYSTYATQTLGKIAVNQEFGMPQYIGDGTWSGQTNNSIATSRAAYFDTIMSNGEANGTRAFIFWNYDHQGSSIRPTPDVPALTDGGVGSEGVTVAAQNTASIQINDAGVGGDVFTGLTQSYDVDPNSSPFTWAVIKAHVASVPAISDAGAGADNEATGVTLSPFVDAGAGADNEATGVTLSPITDAGAGADNEATGVTLSSITDAGAGADTTIIAVMTMINDPATGQTTLVRIAITYAAAAVFVGAGGAASFIGAGGARGGFGGPGSPAIFTGE